MPFCRTKAGTLRLVWQGEEILLDGNGRNLSADLAADIQGHVNVIVGGERVAPAPEPEPEPEPEADESEEEPTRGRRKRSE